VALPVTVVIPAYQAAGTIRRTLDSVLAQTAPPSEILVVDDGSPDAAALEAELAGYGPSVTLVRQPNGGASSARNTGIDPAHQEWIAFLDADDYWEATKLERQFEIIDRYPEVGIVGCRSYLEVPGEPRAETAPQIAPFCGRVLHPNSESSSEASLLVWTCTLVIRRHLFDGRRFETGLETAEDFDLWIRLFSASSAYLLPDLLATYVQEPGGVSRTNLDRDCANMLRVIHRQAHLLGAERLKRQEAIVQRRWAGGYLSQGQPRQALPHAVSRLKSQPYVPEAWWVTFKAAAMSLIS
jgi:glycosyltransferase involved in cell wall biosynthesis